MFANHSSTFSDNSNGTTESRRHRKLTGNLINVVLCLTLGEMYSGTLCTFESTKDVCDYCEPSGSQSRNYSRQYKTCAQCHRKSVRETIWNRTVKINAGTRPGQTIIYAPKVGYTGDAYVLKLEALDHPTFQLHGDDLVMQIPLVLRESLLGLDKVITTLDNRKLSIHVPAGQVVHSDMYIKGEGMPPYQGLTRNYNQDKGNLIIQFQVGLPEVELSKVSELEKCLPPKPKYTMPEAEAEVEEFDLVDAEADYYDPTYEVIDDDYAMNDCYQSYEELNHGFHRGSNGYQQGGSNGYQQGGSNGYQQGGSNGYQHYNRQSAMQNYYFE